MYVQFKEATKYIPRPTTLVNTNIHFNRTLGIFWLKSGEILALSSPVQS